MHVVPEAVVKATSSPSSVAVPARSATWKSPESIGAAASAHPITAEIGDPGGGAGVAGPGLDVVDDGAADGVAAAGRDGVIGVSWVGRCWSSAVDEHPATSTDAAKNSAARTPSG